MKLYIGNLSKETTEEQLNKAFEKFGDVTSCKLITDKISGRSKGYGFVEMSDNESGQKAIDKLDGSELGGNAITVNEARSKSSISNRESGGDKFGGSRTQGGGQRGRNTSRGGNRGD